MGAKIAATKYLQNLKRRIVRERLTFRVVSTYTGVEKSEIY
jgi:hypothetical protein